ncbi:MAG: hypothetical protein HY275_14770, partial [Gemmatimonadetes bacterium]|nr:hypothetical protein [Gemmatimonadota bacterium]
APGVEPLPPGNNVLFIGNSLTYVNDLPGMVAAVAQAGGVTLQVRGLTAANKALVDFVLDGSAQRAIAQGGWKHVVLQQGPTTLPICRDTAVMAVRDIATLARAINANAVVMMSWPSSSRVGDFPKVHESAQMAAVTASAKFAPAGDAWLLANQGDPALAFYGPDGYHPSALGTYLAALVIVEQVAGLDVRTLPTTQPAIAGLPPLSPATLQLLYNAAHTANANGFATPVPVWVPSVPPVPAITC